MEDEYIKRMDQPYKNWLKAAKLMVDVGADVLRQLLSEIAQTPFLNDLVYSWLEQVQEIQTTSYAFALLLRFIKDIGQEDKTCPEILKSHIISWKFTTGHKLTWSEELSTLGQWEQYIEEHLGNSQTNVQGMLLSWQKQIQERLKTLHSTSKSLKQWTTKLLELCQQYRQKLLRKTKTYFDDFLLSSRKQLLEWRHMKKKLQEVITKLENDRKEKLKTWKLEYEDCLKYFLKDIEGYLTSWSKSTETPELKKRLDDFKTEASVINDAKIRESCHEWHEKLHYLFDKWLKKIDKRCKARKSCLLRKSPRKELRCFSSIESLQVMDFLFSIEEKLKTQLSIEQHSKLYPSSGIPNLNECDITIISIVLKNCLMCPLMERWDDDIPNFDNSVGADILRLQSFRRDIVAHTDKRRIEPCKFNKLWSDMKEVLCRLASASGYEYMKEVSTKVDRIKRLSFNEVEVTEIYRILEYCENDTFAEVNGILDRRKFDELMISIQRVKRIKSRLQKPIESSDSDSHSGSADSRSDSESSDSSSSRG